MYINSYLNGISSSVSEMSAFKLIVCSFVRLVSYLSLSHTFSACVIETSEKYHTLYLVILNLHAHQLRTHIHTHTHTHTHIYMHTPSHSYRQLPKCRMEVSSQSKRPRPGTERHHHYRSLLRLCPVCIQSNTRCPPSWRLCTLLHLHYSTVRTSKLLWNVLPHDTTSICRYGEHVRPPGC